MSSRYSQSQNEPINHATFRRTEQLKQSISAKTADSGFITFKEKNSFILTVIDHNTDTRVARFFR
jgi:hypothetical protein